MADFCQGLFLSARTNKGADPRLYQFFFGFYFIGNIAHECHKERIVFVFDNIQRHFDRKSRPHFSNTIYFDSASSNYTGGAILKNTLHTHFMGFLVFF